LLCAPALSLSFNRFSGHHYPKAEALLKQQTLSAGLSACNYVLSLWAFLTLSNCELYLLAFGQSFETSILNRTVVYEYIRTIGLFNEAEAF
jgi:hypothetical protein